MPQFADFEQARAWLAQHPQVRYVDLLLPDQMGIPRGKRVTAAELEGVHTNGLLLPANDSAVMRLGRPKAKLPSCSTDKPLTWPTFSPLVSIKIVSRSIAS